MLNFQRESDLYVNLRLTECVAGCPSPLSLRQSDAHVIFLITELLGDAALFRVTLSALERPRIFGRDIH